MTAKSLSHVLTLIMLVYRTLARFLWQASAVRLQQIENIEQIRQISNYEEVENLFWCRRQEELITRHTIKTNLALGAAFLCWGKYISRSKISMRERKFHWSTIPKDGTCRNRKRNHYYHFVASFTKVCNSTLVAYCHYVTALRSLVVQLSRVSGFVMIVRCLLGRRLRLLNCLSTQARRYAHY